MTGDPHPPGPQDPDEAEVLVAPRYLAGSLLTGDVALAPMLDLRWPHHHDDLGNFYLSSPDQTLRIGYLPEGENFGLWRIIAAADPFAQPLWAGWFSLGTPEEIVQALLATLARDYTDGEQLYLNGPRQTVLAYQPLADAGWHAQRVDDVYGDVYAHVTAPNALAHLAYDITGIDPRGELTLRGDITQAWLLSAGCDSEHDWHATFTRATPTHLIAAVTAAMADPTPVTRDHHHIPPAHLPHVRIRRRNPPALPGNTPSTRAPNTPRPMLPPPRRPPAR